MGQFLGRIQLEAVLYVAFGGAAGSVLRYLCALWLNGSWLATLLVNLTGSLAIGFVAGFVLEPHLRLLLATGFLGGFTTFSTLQLELFASMRAGAMANAALNLGISTAGGLLAVWCGFAIAERLR